MNFVALKRNLPALLTPSTIPLKDCGVLYVEESKFKSRYRQWYQAFETAQCALDGMEIMWAVQKGQLKRCPKGDVCAQNKLINKVFGLAA